MNEGKARLDPRLAAAREVYPRRFYKDVTLAEDVGGFIPLLDGRKVRTPAKLILILPVREFGEAVADEWRRLGEHIDPAAMPLTKLANSALDGVSSRRSEVLDDLVRYASSDLLCYRADAPEGLVQAQRDAWDSVLEALRERYGTHFAVTNGIVHKPQPSGSMAAVRAAFERAESPFLLAALHMMTTLTGSALCTLACADGLIVPNAAWDAAHVDERHQERLWGEDAEALARRRVRRTDFDAAVQVVTWLGGLA